MQKRVILFCFMLSIVLPNTSSSALDEKRETLGLSGNIFSKIMYQLNVNPLM